MNRNPYDVFTENADYQAWTAKHGADYQFGLTNTSASAPAIGGSYRPATFDLSHDSSGQPYFKEGSFREFRLGMIVAIFGPIGALAGYNAFHKRGMTKLQAAAHGVYCALRWKVWAWTAFQVTFFAAWWSLYASWQATGWDKVALIQNADGTISRYAYTLTQNNFFTVSLVLASLAAFIPAVGVTYCQMIDESMFRKRLAYRLMLPAYRALGGVPWYILHMVSLLPFIMMAVKYNI